MNVQLLLLLALVGPFCAFTHASPTVLPADLDYSLQTTESPTDAGVNLSVTAGPPTTKPLVTSQEVRTSSQHLSTVTTIPEVSTISETEAPTTVAPATPEPLITTTPLMETEAPTELGETHQVTEVTEVTVGAEEETSEEVVVEDDTEGLTGAMSSGQVVGIVIGALLAVVIVIAVVIAVVRRMGKYSSTKNKKPAKKDSVMVSSLRKKPAKQKRPKFWKF